MKTKIIQLLQLNENEYTNLLLDNGMMYCKHYTFGDSVGCANLQASKHFWIWWTNQFNNIDNEFIKCYSNTDYTIDYLRSKYARMHNPKYMQVYPSEYVLKSAFGGVLNGKRTTKSTSHVTNR